MVVKARRDELYQRWSALELERSSWVDHWTEISDFLLPRSGRFFVQDRNDGRRRHNKIYDSTGTRALRVLGAGLMGGATSPARPWFRLSTPDPDLMNSAAVKLWLSNTTRLLLDIFARSNTYRTLHMLYEELGAFGTASTLLLDDFENVIHNYPMTIGEYCLATDYKGNVNTFAREFEKTVGNLVTEFGYENCSTATRSAYDRGDIDRWVTVVHLIEPRSDRDKTKRDPANMAWRSVYFEKGGEEGKYLRDSGFNRFRALCPRWSVTGGDIYGNSPGMEALGDIKQLQHEQLRKAEGIDYQTKPPVVLPTSAKHHEINLFPGGHSFVDTTQQNSVRSAFEVNLNLQHLLLDIQDVRQRVRETFYTDLFLMLASQPNSRMTATEVAERHEEKLLMLGPVLERLHNELLDPLVTMTFERALATGLVEAPPEELQGENLNVEYISMLAQAQRAVSTNAVDRFVGNLGMIAQFKPNVLDKFDEDKWAEQYSDALGVDPELIVPDKKVALIRNQRAQQQAAANAAAMAQTGADAASKLAGADTGGKNALTDVMSGLTGYSTPTGA